MSSSVSTQSHKSSEFQHPTLPCIHSLMYAADTTEPLHQVKLLSALRSGKQPTSLLSTPYQTPQPQATLLSSFHFSLKLARTDQSSKMQTSTLVLQPFISPFAVLLVSLPFLPQIAPPHPPKVDTVQLLLSHRAISPNGVHPPASGTTPLHLAASLGRVDIVSLLLDQPGIDDTLRDANGKTSKDVAKGKEVVQILQGAYPSSLSPRPIPTSLLS